MIVAPQIVGTDLEKNTGAATRKSETKKDE